MVLSFFNREPQAPPPDPMLLLAEAQEFLKTDDFASALEKFDELCALPVQSPLPLLSRATCRLQLKQYPGVLEDCQKVLQFLNSDIEGHGDEGCTTVHSLALMRMAKAHKELGQLDEAKSALMRKNAIEHKLGRDKTDSGDEGDRKKEQETADEWKEKGNAEFKKKNWAKALEYYRNGLGYDLYNSKLHSNTCMTLIELKKWTQALKHAEQCIALEPQWVKGYYLKGLILSNESKIEQALVALKKAIEIEPSNSRIKALLSEVEGRVEYVESRLQRRKNGGAKPQTKEAAAVDEKKTKKEDAQENEEPVEDVDSDEDYCNEDGCRTPKKIKFKVSRKQIMDTALEVGVAVVGVAVVCWFINKYN